jgi:preprotein translocase subunit SecY
MSGITLSLCSFLSDLIPRPIAWGGLVLWLITLLASIFGLLGKLDYSLIVWFAAKILLLIYLAAVGIIIERTITKRFDTPVAAAQN